MPWIDVIDEKDATGELKELYEKIKKTRGKVGNIIKIHSLNTRAMDAHVEFYMAIMFGKAELSREEREIIAVTVSAANKCDYCINHHAEALNYYWKDDQKIQLFIEGSDSLELPKRHRLIINYAQKLTNSPQDNNQEDITKLKQFGFSDREILDITLITGYFNFINRVALGLGVEYSAEEVAGYNF
ncbi:MAG: peroxidase-related enzyme [Bacteroidetes bacterium]|nr:peroxidase-related enzyme [Bacteroidota bacterium]